MSVAVRLSLALLPAPDDAHERREQLIAQCSNLGRRLLAFSPHDPVGLAAAAVGQLGSPNQAMQLAAQSLKRRDTYAGQLVLGWLFEQGQQHAAAVVALEDALRHQPDAAAARRALVRCLGRRTAASREARTGLYTLLTQTRDLLSSRHETSDLAMPVGQLSRELDAPLLVAVMGEFNTGKSTFVNALIGEEIAPMGITPTTATINLLKYGAERAARIVWQDGREELLSWERVPTFLRELTTRVHGPCDWSSCCIPTKSCSGSTW